MDAKYTVSDKHYGCLQKQWSANANFQASSLLIAYVEKSHFKNSEFYPSFLKAT